MFCARYLFLFVALFSLAGCGDMMDDLDPSGDDLRPTVEIGSTGSMPGQKAADFALKDSLGNDFVLSAQLAGSASPADVVVLYFTMWCPVCLAHTDHMYSNILPRFRDRGASVFALVDYVSGSVAATRASEKANGYAGSDFVTLSDVDRSLFEQLNGGMGTVVVIDSSGNILMNEDYRHGGRLADILEQQLP